MTDSLAKWCHACNKNRIHDSAAMLVLKHFVIKTIGNALKDHMNAKKKSTPIKAIVCNINAIRGNFYICILKWSIIF